MAKKLNEIMQKLPRARQEKIEARAAELIAPAYDAKRYESGSRTDSRAHGRTAKDSSRQHFKAGKAYGFTENLGLKPRPCRAAFY